MFKKYIVLHNNTIYCVFNMKNIQGTILLQKMSSSGITSIGELPRSNIQNNNVHQEYMMQQLPQNIVLNKTEIISSSNNQMPGMDNLIPSGGYSMQNPMIQNNQAII